MKSPSHESVAAALSELEAGIRRVTDAAGALPRGDGLPPAIDVWYHAAHDRLSHVCNELSRLAEIAKRARENLPASGSSAKS